MRDVRVLMVDDDDAFRRWLREHLHAAGYEVLEAGAGSDGLTVAREQRPDLILLDWRMPDVSGVQVCRELRDDPRTIGIPIIIVTALHDLRDRHLALRAGADAFLAKEGEPVALLELVADLARNGRPAAGSRYGDPA
jgi:DNA-binding response OmpR family regulator